MDANNRKPRSKPEQASTVLSRSWNGTPISRRASDGYVNATAMCKANGKLWGHFFETDRCGQYLEALSETIGIPVVSSKGLVQTREGRNGGTWVHPDVATELARWISPAFSVFVNQWFREAVENQQQPVQAADPAPVAVQPAFGFVQPILEALENRRDGNKGISSIAAASGLAFHHAHNAGNVQLTGHPAKHWREVSGHDNWQQHADWPWQKVKGMAGLGSMAMVEQLPPDQRDPGSVRQCIEFSHAKAREFAEAVGLSPQPRFLPRRLTERRVRALAEPARDGGAQLALPA